MSATGFFRNKRPSHVYTVALILNSEDANHILLQRKARPKWQEGKLNGPGGKVERGEGPLDCVHREVREETGLEIQTFRLVCRLHCVTPSDPYSLVYFYWGLEDHNTLYEASFASRNKALSEPLIYIRMADLGRDDIHPNLRYISQMARNFATNSDERAHWFDIYEGQSSAHETLGGGY